MKIVSADEALTVVQSGHRVFVHEAAMAPTSLLEALARRGPELTGVEVVHLHVNGPAPHLAPTLAGHLRHNALFVGPSAREAVSEGRADFTPVFLSEVPNLFHDGSLPLDVALVQVSPPNRHGYCRLGVLVAAARSAVDHARVVIAEINERVPRTDGHTAIHVDQIDFGVEVERPLPEHVDSEPTDVERRIGALIAEHVPDGATLQMGIGTIPDAVLAQLHGRSELGVHTEMFTDGLVKLVKSGAVTGSKKTMFKNRVIASFAMGSRALYTVSARPRAMCSPSSRRV